MTGTFVGMSGPAPARSLARTLLREAPLERNPDKRKDDRRDSLKTDDVRLLPDRQPEHDQQSLQACPAPSPQSRPAMWR